jgi:hypothetical protein
MQRKTAIAILLLAIPAFYVLAKLAITFQAYVQNIPH